MYFIKLIHIYLNEAFIEIIIFYLMYIYDLLRISVFFITSSFSFLFLLFLSWVYWQLLLLKRVPLLLWKFSPVFLFQKHEELLLVFDTCALLHDRWWSCIWSYTYRGSNSSSYKNQSHQVLYLLPWIDCLAIQVS